MKSFPRRVCLISCPGFALSPHTASLPHLPSMWPPDSRRPPEFPSFEVLNMGQPANVLAATLTQEQKMTYEHLRDFVAQPTWSS